MSIKQDWSTIKNLGFLFIYYNFFFFFSIIFNLLILLKQKKACNGVIKLMYEAVNDIGCIAYVNAIDKDCECL